MESIMNDPSFRELLAKHLAEQMIAKSLIPAAAALAAADLPPAALAAADLSPAALAAADLPPAAPAAVDLSPAALAAADLPPAAPAAVDLPAADLPPVDLPPADLPPVDLSPADLLSAAAAAPAEDSAASSCEEGECSSSLSVSEPGGKAAVSSAIVPFRSSSKLDMPLEMILSGTKRSASTFHSTPVESYQPSSARELIQRAIASAKPIPYSFSFRRFNLYKILLPHIGSYSPEEIASVNIATLLTHVANCSYDIFMEKRSNLIKVGVKLISMGLYFYRYPNPDLRHFPLPPYKIGPHIHEFMNRVKEFIISTFLYILSDRENMERYNYYLDIQPNWKCKNTFCKIYSSSFHDLDYVMKLMYDNCFSSRLY